MKNSQSTLEIVTDHNVSNLTGGNKLQELISQREAELAARAANRPKQGFFSRLFFGPQDKYTYLQA